MATASKGGRRPGAGRKSKAEEVGLKRLLSECWTQDQRRKCVRALADRASRGDMEAVKLLFSYTFGKPKESQELKGKLAVTVRYVDRPIDPEAG
jgi:hypothetical protein